MKKNILFSMMCLMALPMFSQTIDSVQWDAYSRIIPSYKEIIIHAAPDEAGQNGYYYEITMSIYNNYHVSFYSYRKEGTGGQLFMNGTYNANGNVTWDSQANKMKIKLEGEAEADFSYGVTARVAEHLKGKEFKGKRKIYQYLTLRYDNREDRFYVTGFDPVKVSVGGASLGGKADVFIPVDLDYYKNISSCEFK